MTSPIHDYYMQVALNWARRGVGHVAPNPAVGCVLVKNGVIIAAAHTACGGRPHAETIALEKAGYAAKGATAYVTLEPCAHHGQTPPCAQALIDAGVAGVVVACGDHDPRVSGRGVQMLRDTGIEVIENVLEAQALSLNAGFFMRINAGRPFVTLKMAISADGKIGVRGERTQISGDLAGRHMHLQRSLHDAILVGVNTARVDNPLLSTRMSGHSHVMTRVLLDAKLDLPLDCALVGSAQNDPVLVFYASGDVDKIKTLEQAGVGLIRQDPHDLKTVLRILAERGVTRLLVEGGARIHDSFIKRGLVDEVQVCKSPMIIGENGLDMVDVSLLKRIKLQHMRVLGDDIVEFYQ